MLATFLIAAGAVLVAPRESAVETFPDLRLALTLPALEDLNREAVKKTGADQYLTARWTGGLGESRVRLSLYALPIELTGDLEPRDVLPLIEDGLRTLEGLPGFAFERTEVLLGDFGCAPYAGLGTGVLRSQDGSITGRFLALGGRTAEYAYSIEIDCKPSPGEAETAVLREFLAKGVEYDGPEWDPRWTDAEAQVRWERDAPKDLAQEMKDPLRTDHFIVLTNSSSGKLFCKKMEECYSQIRKMFPFEDVAGERLLPVFLFRTPDQYFEYTMKVTGMDRAGAEATGGHAFRDYYATWYAEPNDPTHLHEATHQIFRNRLFLVGAGSWFQEGVAQYISTRDNEQNMVAQLAAKGRHVPLKQFFQIQQMISSTEEGRRKGADEASNNYSQAALVIEFLRESKFGKERFLDFVRTAGRVTRGDLPALEKVFLQIYDVDLTGLEEAFVAYCKKR